ncbi:MAG: 5-(carboxyamino)imidazole ribonucleotide mutase [Deltaproteobacteria bacterium]|nr:5-(carboxyamino)imidazole ribonucleotide mutase [Deltaproteobacteria bacterium]
MTAPRVLIVMGSDSDRDKLAPCWEMLDQLGIGYAVRVASAHRTPERVVELARTARELGFGVIVAGAGLAAHLAGMIAAHTTLPVVAVPVVSGTLGGVDALLSTVQMPPGVPLASVGIGGATNAGLYAAAILGAHGGGIAARLGELREAQAKRVVEADERIRAETTPA